MMEAQGNEYSSQATLSSVDLDTHSSDKTALRAEEDVTHTDVISTKKSGQWYPGKYMPLNIAFKALSNSLKKEDTDDFLAETSSAQEAELMARMKEEERYSISGQLQEEEEKEALICATVRAVRRKFLERELVGKVFISRMSGVISTSITSDITAEDVSAYILSKADDTRNTFGQHPVEVAELTGQYKRALSMTDTILNSMERRSRTWEKVDFSHNTHLTRGATIGVSDPIVGMINFSVTLQLTATTKSLFKSRKRFEDAREVALSRVTES